MNDTGRNEEQVREAGAIARLLSYVLILVGSIALFGVATGIPTSRFERLGAGAFPEIVFGALSLVAALAVIDALRTIPRRAYGRFAARAVDWARRRYLVFISLGALTVYLLAIPVLGFSIASLIFLFTLQVILMPRRPKSILIAAAVAVVFSFGLNWVFAEIFTVFLPRGVL